MIWMLMGCNVFYGGPNSVLDTGANPNQTNYPGCAAGPLAEEAEANPSEGCAGYVITNAVSDTGADINYAQECVGTRPFFAWSGPSEAQLMEDVINWNLHVLTAPEADLWMVDMEATIRVRSPSPVTDYPPRLFQSLSTIINGDTYNVTSGSGTSGDPDSLGYDEVRVRFHTGYVVIPAGECQTITFNMDNTGLRFASDDWIEIRLAEDDLFYWSIPDEGPELITSRYDEVAIGTFYTVP